MIGTIYEISIALILLAFAVVAVGGSIHFVISLFRPSGIARHTSSYSVGISSQERELKKMNEIITRNRNDSRSKPDYYGGI